MNPKIFVYNIISLDGRIEWVKNDFTAMTEYYKIAFRWDIDAVLMGSNSIYELGNHEDISKVNSFETPIKMPIPDEIKPLIKHKTPTLIVPDSTGKISNWSLMQQQPWYSDIIVLCSESTPKEYLEYLNNKGIKYIIAGNKKIDFNKALPILNEKYGISKIRTDCGGKLTGHLLSLSLVNELKILISPLLTGGNSTPNLTENYNVTNSIELSLKETECIEDKYVLLTYKVK
ncbi:MAG: dihydrofolate reductase family protein [Hyphomicrobiales bacterium]